MQTHEYLDAFKCLFSWTRLNQSETELRYFFRSQSVAKIMEAKADEVIKEFKMPIQAVTETWTVDGMVREIALVVTTVPDEVLFKDEVVDDEGLSGGWWNK